MAKKGLYKVFRTKEEYEFFMANERHFARVWMMDHVTIALGRMGFRESKFKEFDKVLDEVMTEFMEDYKEDLKADKDMVYSKFCLERELQQYVGSLYKPMAERYK